MLWLAARDTYTHLAILLIQSRRSGMLEDVSLLWLLMRGFRRQPAEPMGFPAWVRIPQVSSCDGEARALLAMMSTSHAERRQFTPCPLGQGGN